MNSVAYPTSNAGSTPVGALFEGSTQPVSDTKFVRAFVDFNNNMTVGEYCRLVALMIEPSEKLWWLQWVKDNVSDPNEPLGKIEVVEGQVLSFLTPNKQARISVQIGLVQIDGESFKYPKQKSFKEAFLNLEKISQSYIRKNRHFGSSKKALFKMLVNRAQAGDNPYKNLLIEGGCILLISLVIGIGVYLMSVAPAAALAGAFAEFAPIIIFGALAVMAAIVLKGFFWNLPRGEPFWSDLDKMKSSLARGSEKVRYLAGSGQQMYASLENSKKQEVNKIVREVFRRMNENPAAAALIHEGAF